MIKSYILSIVFLLFFILTIPHTIAIRNGLFYLLCISLLILTWNSRKIIINSFINLGMKKIFIILIVLTCYILLHSLVISHETSWSLDEFRGQWLTPILYFLVGTFLAFYILNSKVTSKELFLTVIFYSLFIHIIYVDLVALDRFLETKNLITRYGGLTGSPVLANYLTNILLAFIISELVYRKRTKKTVLNIPTSLLLIYFTLTLFSSIVESMRNGSVAIVFLSIMGIFFLFYNEKKYSMKLKILVSSIIIIILILPITFNIKKDARWNTLIQTIPIALDTKNNKYWLNRSYGLPTFPDGTEVSGSNYERVAWAYEGSKIIFENPLGIGFGRNAFGHALEMKYGKDAQRGYHSHSSIIDLTIGIGLIGLLLWSFFIILVIKNAVKLFKTEINFFAMLTFFLTTGFFTRSLVDSNMRDHMFLQFMFLVGVSLVFMFKEKSEQKIEIQA